MHWMHERRGWGALILPCSMRDLEKTASRRSGLWPGSTGTVGIVNFGKRLENGNVGGQESHTPGSPHQELIGNENFKQSNEVTRPVRCLLCHRLNVMFSTLARNCIP
jgi:hypothetical protein